VAGLRTTRGRLALAPAAIGGAVLVVSAFSSWAQPAHVPWPSYADGVPDFISAPSDALFRIVAGLLGAVALVLVGRGMTSRFSWALLAALGIGGVVLGVVGLDAVSHHRGFGSIVANDMTIEGFHHGVLNYVELAGASLLCVSPLGARTASRSTGR
jgi:hypothetical protein